jgi:hypothetical protein
MLEIAQLAETGRRKRQTWRVFANHSTCCLVHFPAFGDQCEHTLHTLRTEPPAGFSAGLQPYLRVYYQTISTDKQYQSDDSKTTPKTERFRSRLITVREMKQRQYETTKYRSQTETKTEHLKVHERPTNSIKLIQGLFP